MTTGERIFENLITAWYLGEKRHSDHVDINEFEVQSIAYDAMDIANIWEELKKEKETRK